MSSLFSKDILELGKTAVYPANARTLATVVSAKTVEVKLEMIPGGIISGHVYNADGTPVTDALVRPCTSHIRKASKSSSRTFQKPRTIGANTAFTGFLPAITTLPSIRNSPAVLEGRARQCCR
jgi:hypothetical protein